MAKTDITNALRGELAEVYFKHFSKSRGYAYARAEDVGWDLLHRNVIIFKQGFRRLQIKLPEESVECNDQHREALKSLGQITQLPT